MDRQVTIFSTGKSDRVNKQTERGGGGREGGREREREGGREGGRESKINATCNISTKTNKLQRNK